MQHKVMQSPWMKPTSVRCRAVHYVNTTPSNLVPKSSKCSCLSCLRSPVILYRDCNCFLCMPSYELGYKSNTLRQQLELGMHFKESLYQKDPLDCHQECRACQQEKAEKLKYYVTMKADLRNKLTEDFNHKRMMAKPYRQHCQENTSIGTTPLSRDRKPQQKKRFKCLYCYKSFGKSSHLRDHHRTHSGERPFTCTYCGKAFSQFSNLRTHVRIHTGEKPFKCQICEKSFTQRVTLRSHLRTHSSDSIQSFLQDSTQSSMK